jgi:cytoskeletal protein CcmA (bactofilin family)
MSRKTKIFSAVTLFILLTLSLAPAVAAFDGREGNKIVIGADETVQDDLYLSAETIIIDGTIQGDLTAAAKTIIINGSVEGDLLAAAESIIINGEVSDDVRVFAAAIQLASSAKVGDDLFFGGAGIETKTGSLVEGDLLAGASQALIAGDTGGDVFAAVSAFELRGHVEGNVSAYVSPADKEKMPPTAFGPSMKITFPAVDQGITVSDTASIGGDFRYTAAKDISLPAGTVGGETARIQPSYTDWDEEYDDEFSLPSTREVFQQWVLDFLRTASSLFLVGLLLGWLFPDILAAGEYTLRTKPLPSLGWGVVAYAAFFFVLLVIFTGMAIGTILFSALTLNGLSGLIMTLGLLLIIALIFGFIFIVAYASKIIVSELGGNLILARVKPEWVNHRIYPLLVGVILLSLIMSIPVVDFLAKLIIVLFALGALWILGGNRFRKKETAA